MAGADFGGKRSNQSYSSKGSCKGDHQHKRSYAKNFDVFVRASVYLPLTIKPVN